MEMARMDSNVWEKLSSDLLMKVLSYLPSPSCLRLRTVCKSWKNIIDSSDFLDLCAELWNQRPWFLVFQRLKLDAVHMYDAMDRKWYTFPVSFLPVTVYGRSAAGSLLCVEERKDSFFKALYVCDPLAKTWIKLPPMMEETYWRSRSVTLIVDEFIGAFKVFVGCNFRMQVYDSRSNSWQRLGQTPMDSVVLCKPKKTLYALSPAPGLEIVPKPYRLLSFHLEDGAWRLVDIRMPRCLTSPHLAESEDGRIMMVGGVWRKNMVRSLRIWELNFEGNSWDKVCRVPKRLWKLLTAGNWNTACAWSGEWISIVSCNRVLSYNINNREWIVSPPSAADPSLGDLMSVYPFKPTGLKILQPSTSNHIGLPMYFGHQIPASL